MMRYLASKLDCKGYLKPQCCRNTPPRTIR
jgi:hypothetical protein